MCFVGLIDRCCTMIVNLILLFPRNNKKLKIYRHKDCIRDERRHLSLIKKLGRDFWYEVVPEIRYHTRHIIFWEILNLMAQSATDYWFWFWCQRWKSNSRVQINPGLMKNLFHEFNLEWFWWWYRTTKELVCLIAFIENDCNWPWNNKKVQFQP